MIKHFYLLIFPVLKLVDGFHIGTMTAEKFWLWKNRYPECLYGILQTPIHIETFRAETVLMPALNFIDYENFLAPPITLQNNGHTVKLKPGEYVEGSQFRVPRVTGGFLTSEFELETLHFHWGMENDRGSEHVLNNLRYPLEMHIIHRNKNYRNLDEATRHKDGIVVLAFFFRLRMKHNNYFKIVTNALSHLEKEGDAINFDRSFALANLLPKKVDSFFTYNGSLSTPPCSEVVTWFVFPDSIPISFEQIQKFRKLSIRDNFRSLQPIGNRRIFYRQRRRYLQNDEIFGYEKNISLIGLENKKNII